MNKSVMIEIGILNIRIRPNIKILHFVPFVERRWSVSCAKEGEK